MPQDPNDLVVVNKPEPRHPRTPCHVRFVAREDGQLCMVMMDRVRLAPEWQSLEDGRWRGELETESRPG